MMKKNKKIGKRTILQLYNPTTELNLMRPNHAAYAFDVTSRSDDFVSVSV